MKTVSAIASDCLDKARSQGSRPGLERMRELLGRLGNPENRVPLIQVAGTNGKGSVCAFLESTLIASGLRTGMFLSPPLNGLEEMYRLEGRPISRERLDVLIARIAEAAYGMDALACGYPTEFEVLTGAAFLLFPDAGCQAVVLETGMGGLLDATNVAASNLLAVITRISLEHEAWLGHSLGEIAAHKAGIIRTAGRAVVWDLAPEAMETVRATARRIGATLQVPDAAAIRVERIAPEAMTFSAEGMETLTTRLIGRHQAENAALAIAAVRLLRESGIGIPDEALRMGLSQADWPGRFETFACRVPFVLDCAHNPDGVRTFVETFRAAFPGKRLNLVFGAMRDKDVQAMLSAVAPIAERILCVEPDNPRAMPLDELVELAKRTCGDVGKSDTIEQAVLECLAEAHPETVCAAIGSIYYMGRARSVLLNLRT